MKIAAYIRLSRIFSAGCGLANLQLASRLSRKIGQLLVNKLCMLLVLNVA